MSLGLSHMTVVPKLFRCIHYGSAVIGVIIVVDDLIGTKKTTSAETFMHRSPCTVELGNIFCGFGKMRFYEISFILSEDYWSYSNADEKQ